jgi:hypothetical protein
MFCIPAWALILITSLQHVDDQEFVVQQAPVQMMPFMASGRFSFHPAGSCSPLLLLEVLFEH